MSQLRNDDRGFTLVELLVVMLLLAVIGTYVTSALITAMQNTRQTQTRIEAMAELQRGAERVARELRAACPIVGGLDANAITAAILRDGAIEQHTFWYDGASDTLRHSATRRDGASWVPMFIDRVLVRDLDPSGPVFTHYGYAGNPPAWGQVTQRHQVRSVRLTLRRDLPEQSAVEVETLVGLRNGGRSCD